MRYAEYVLTGWGATFGAVGAYAAWVMVRGRRLARRVPEYQRRWRDS